MLLKKLKFLIYIDISHLEYRILRVRSTTYPNTKMSTRPCRFGPKCNKGDTCPFTHTNDVCWFGSKCTDKKCTRTHDTTIEAKPCRSGSNCSKKDTCAFTHPETIEFDCPCGEPIYSYSLEGKLTISCRCSDTTGEFTPLPHEDLCDCGQSTTYVDSTGVLTTSCPCDEDDLIAEDRLEDLSDEMEEPDF